MSHTQLEAEAESLIPGWTGDSISEASTVPALNKDDKFRALARLIGCCLCCFAAGWHDGCAGALIPYLQVYYGGVSDKKVALIFIGGFSGFVLASLLNVTLSNRFGLGRLIVSGAVAQGVASAIIASRPPFLTIAACYSLAGFGLAMQDTQFNTYVARLPGAETKLGIVHAIYGLGALLSPTVATLLMKAGLSPPLFYWTNVAFCVLTAVVLFTGFGFRGISYSGGQACEGSPGDKVTALKTVVKSRVVWASLLFITLYTGSETTEAGWVVSFLMRERDGKTMSGYASTAFYTGLTSSRVMLLPITALLTEKIAVTLYAVIALVMQVIVWISPSFTVNLIAVAACGFVMGPIYPITVSLVTKATPRGYHPGALSLMGCVGQSGSAMFPFVVGALADKYSIKVLQPVLVTMFGTMALLWQLVPSPKVSSYSSTHGPKPSSIIEEDDEE